MKKICKSELPKIPPEVLLDCSVRIYNAQNINADKEYVDGKPTPKQTAYLKKIEKFKEDMSFDEAKQVISEHIEGQKKKEVEY